MDIEKPSAQSKYLVFTLISLLVLIGVAVLFFINNVRVQRENIGKTREERYDFDRDRSIDGEGRLDPIVTDIDPSNDRGDAYFLTKILKGYSQRYDDESKVIRLKNKFLESSSLQSLEVSVKNSISFYCWPEKYQGSSGMTDVGGLEFYIYPDQRDIIFPGERRVSIDLLDSFLNPDIYLIIQLFDNFNIDDENEVQKLILLGC